MKLTAFDRSNAMPKALTDDQIRFYRDNGFLTPCDGIDAADTEPMLRDLQDFEASQGYCVGTMNLKAHLCFRRSFELSSTPAILDVVEDLIGPNILVFASHFWIKPGDDATFVSWHQDSAYIGLDPHELVTVWLALTDSNPANGCMRMLPGTHLGETYAHTETYDEKNLLSRGQAIENIDDSNAADLILKAGQFSCHHERIIHGSNTNQTGKARVGLSFFYIPTHVRSTSGRRTAHLVRGIDDFGHWDDDPVPEARIDTGIIDHVVEVNNRYKQNRQEAEAAG